MRKTITVRNWREVDALFAERVMGLVPCQASCHSAGKYLPCHASPESPQGGAETVLYSLSLDAAMLGVEKIEGHWFELQSPFASGCQWYAGFTPHDTTGWNGRPDVEAQADTAARAAVLACLKMRGVGIELGPEGDAG